MSKFILIFSGVIGTLIFLYLINDSRTNDDLSIDFKKMFNSPEFKNLSKTKEFQKLLLSNEAQNFLLHLGKNILLDETGIKN